MKPKCRADNAGGGDGTLIKAEWQDANRDLEELRSLRTSKRRKLKQREKQRSDKEEEIKIRNSICEKTHMSNQYNQT